MALESPTFINGLVAENPTSTDRVAEAADHLRILKSSLKTTFPNINGAVTVTPAELNRLDGLQTPVVNNLVPPGAIFFFASSTAPDGFLHCNGAALSKSTYNQLYVAIGTTWGSTTETFNIPDLRGEFIRAWTAGSATDAGRVFGSFQGDAIRNIEGTLGNVWIRTGSGSGHSGALYESENRGNNRPSDGSSTSERGILFDASRVVPTAVENRPRNVALLACIKY